MPAKGANPYAAKRLTQDILWFGYPRVIWKSDQEPSIVSLRELVQQMLGTAVDIAGQAGNQRVGVGFEESAVGESKSNGSAENVVQHVQG